MKEIKLTQGKVALVDDEDFEKLNILKWAAMKRRKHIDKFVAFRNGYINGKMRVIRMHRFILNVTDSKIQVDHINGNPLDNRKENLRLCSNAENNMNKEIRPDNTTGYKGVYFHKRANKYLSQIWYNQKHYYLGLFESPIDAAKVYNAKAIELHGEFAYLNKI